MRKDDLSNDVSSGISNSVDKYYCYQSVMTLLHLFLTISIKLPTEAIVESYWSTYEHIVDKRRSNLTDEHKFQEFFVKSTSPPIQKANGLLRKALNKKFGRNWHFQTNNGGVGPVLARKKQEIAKLPFIRAVKCVLKCHMAYLATFLGLGLVITSIAQKQCLNKTRTSF